MRGRTAVRSLLRRGAGACALALLAGSVWAQAPRPARPPLIPGLAPRKLPGYGLLRVVRVAREGLIPKDLRVQAGTTVVWFNTTAGFATVTFSEGRKLVEASRSPTLFYLAPDGTFTSSAFGPAGVASITFLDPGKYAFFVTGLDALEGAAFGTVEVTR
ncbi:MAG: hypothetical protein ACE5JJ_06620 [Nitrospinota bacterium]